MNRTRLIAIIVIILVVLAALVGGLVYYNAHHLPKGVITYEDPHLTDQERQTIQGQLADTQNKIKALPNSASDKDRYQLYMQEGLLYGELGQFKEARAAYLQAVNYIKDNATPYHELFVVENRMHYYDPAKEHIEKAVSLNGGNPQFWTDRITLMKEHFNASVDQLASLYQEALQKTNGAVDVITSYAGFLESKGDSGGAIAQWQAALAKNPAGASLYNQEISRLQGK